MANGEITDINTAPQSPPSTDQATTSPALRPGDSLSLRQPVAQPLTQTYFGGAGEEEGEEKWVEERECGEMLRPSLRSVLKSIALLFVFGT
ncbi:hypothetical protein LguiA_031347 [Lonicera macranthoides]